MLSLLAPNTLALQHGGALRPAPSAARAAQSAFSMATPDEFTLAVLGDLHVSRRAE